MKLQNLSIIFIVIMIPILLIVSYYIGLQIDTINKQTAYDTKLQEAVGEAIYALEINTVEWNQNFEELSDSKRRDVAASINTFTKSMANKMGIGGSPNELVLQYIPAVIYTLYDGYYVYANSETFGVNTTDTGVALKDNTGKLDLTGETTYDHLLQSFTPYSETLTDNANPNNYVTINYTLDNFVRVYGIIDGDVIDNHGFLTLDGKIESEYSSLYKQLTKVDYNNYDLLDGEILSEKIYYYDDDGTGPHLEIFTYVYDMNNTKFYYDTVTDQFFYLSPGKKRVYANTLFRDRYKKIVEYEETTPGSGLYIKKDLYQSLTKKDDDGIQRYTVYEYDELLDQYVITMPNFLGENKTDEYNDTIGIDYSSRNYCVESYIFTEWFNEEIGGRSWSTNAEGVTITGNPFNISGTNDVDPEIGDEYYNSDFTKHKMDVMKTSISRTLGRVVQDANAHLPAGVTYEYRLPELSYSDWDKLLSNVSILGFLQGVPIGLKYYNNYAIACSSNNNEYVDPEQIYLGSEDDEYYHRRGCQHLTAANVVGYRSTEYILKREENDIYYMHDTNTHNNTLACYNCIVDSNNYILDKSINVLETAYYKTLARERYVAQSQITPNVTIPITPPPAETYTYTIKYIDMADNSIIRIDSDTVDAEYTEYVGAPISFNYGGNSYTRDASSLLGATITKTNNEIEFKYNKVVTPVVASFSVEAIAYADDSKNADGSYKDRDRNPHTIDGNLEVGSQRGVRITASSGTSIYKDGSLIYTFNGEDHWDDIYGAIQDFGEEHTYSLEDESEAITVRDWTIACKADLTTFRDSYVNTGNYFPNIVDVIDDFTAEDFANNSTELIGTDSNKFNKTFEGNNHTITIDGGIGLFAYNKGKIQNLNLNVTIDATMDGTIARTRNVGGVVAHNEAKIENVHILSGTIKGKVTEDGIDSFKTGANDGIGGIVGFNDAGAQILRCSNNANITCDANGGGIAGVNFGATISESFNEGTVSTDETIPYNRIGGIVGVNGGKGKIVLAEGLLKLIMSKISVQEAKNSTIEFCYNTGTINGQLINIQESGDPSDGRAYKRSMMAVGGIAGVCDDIPIDVTIDSGTSSKLIGWIQDMESEVVSGIENIGVSMWKINQCYDIGEVGGGRKANAAGFGLIPEDKIADFNPCNGGIVGYAYSNEKTGSITNCFYQVGDTFLFIETKKKAEGALNGQNSAWLQNGAIIWNEGDYRFTRLDEDRLKNRKAMFLTLHIGFPPSITYTYIDNYLKPEHYKCDYGEYPKLVNNTGKAE